MSSTTPGGRWVIDLAVCLMAGGMLLGAVPLILVFVGDSRDSRRYHRARELRLRERHVRTLEWELDVEPYPWGPLDG
jgi:hypothetical protein